MHILCLKHHHQWPGAWFPKNLCVIKSSSSVPIIDSIITIKHHQDKTMLSSWSLRRAWFPVNPCVIKSADAHLGIPLLLLPSSLQNWPIPCQSTLWGKPQLLLEKHFRRSAFVSSVLAAWNKTRVGSVLRHKGEFWQTPLRTPQSPPTVERGLIKGPSWGQGVLGETSLLLRTANSNENRIFEKSMNHRIQSQTELCWCRTCISMILCGAQNWKHLE